MGRFCIFQKNKTVNYYVQVCVGQAGHAKQNCLSDLSVDGCKLYVTQIIISEMSLEPDTRY